jgi:hypothetical protein
MNNYVIWYPHGNDEDTSWSEYRLSERLGIRLFDHAEVHCTQFPPELDGYDDRKKIAFIRHESIWLSTTESHYTGMLDRNLSLYDYDLVIVYTTEPVRMDWATYRKEVETQLQTNRVMYIIGGHLGDANPDPDICYVPHSFFSIVSAGNSRPDDIDLVPVTKPYLFDALLGTLKVPRLWAYYHIRDSDFYNQSLINIQPFIDPTVNKGNQDAVKALLPELVEKYGEINDYETPELFALEETRIQQFKQKAVTLEDRYSNRRIPNMTLGRMPASTLIPWTIYDNSWYSIISETNPVWCDVNFLTEKTAKCLAAMRVFVMFNAPGTLRYLRSLGFQTFHGEFIDESYDDQHGNELRWQMAWEQVKKLAAADPVKVYQYYQPVLEFNAKLMETYTTNELKNIADFVYNHKFLSDNFPLHADKSFYRKDKNNLLYTSPFHIKNTDYFVWDPHRWWEFNVGLKKGTEFFPNAEIYRGLEPPSGAKVKELAGDSRKKIAMLCYERIWRPWTQPDMLFDPTLSPNIANLHLGWADLVVLYTSEQMKDWWPVIYGEVCRQLHTDRIVLMVAGHTNYTDPDPNFIFVNHQSFLSYVATGNAFMDVNEVTVPFRKYMFDCLIGTVKPTRLGLFYRLLDSGLANESLINLQPNPHWEPDWKVVERLSPGMVNKHGAVINYSSPALIDLEEDVIKEFKTRTQHGSAHDRYSANLVSRPGFDLPNNELIMSNIVPWKIYQSSWYSIVCETVDSGTSTLFVTEKIAKCLFAKRVFIVVTGGGILKYLRSLGFRTFHGDIIDESYDDEPNDKLRLNMAWEQIQRLYKTEPRAVYAHFRDVLEHNHQLMLGWTDQQLQDISQFLQKRLDYVCSRANYKNVHGLFPK